MAHDEVPEDVLREHEEQILWSFKQAGIEPRLFERESNGKGLRDFALERILDGVQHEIRGGVLWTIRWRARGVFHNPRENRSFREKSRYHRGHTRVQPAPQFNPIFWNSHSIRGTRNPQKESWLEAICRETREEWGPKGLEFDDSQMQPIKLLNALTEPVLGPSEVYYSTMSERHDQWFQLTTEDFSCMGDPPHGETIVNDGATMITLKSFEYNGFLLFDFDYP